MKDPILVVKCIRISGVIINPPASDLIATPRPHYLKDKLILILRMITVVILNPKDLEI